MTVVVGTTFTASEGNSLPMFVMNCEGAEQVSRNQLRLGRRKRGPYDNYRINLPPKCYSVVFRVRLLVVELLRCGCSSVSVSFVAFDVFVSSV